jgi:enterochelin esterase-like enzyme
MKTAMLSLALVPMLSAVPGMAQPARGGGGGARGNPIGELQTNSVEDFKPSASVQQGSQYPQVNSEHRVRTRVRAPGATNVLLDISGVKYPLTKTDNGFWTGDSTPQDQGFHYYQIEVDGASVPDPGSLYFYGASRWGSGVEVPADDQDFYALKNVPHGQLRQVLYYSKISGSVRDCYIYTPPDYDKDVTQRYPVLYLQHGMGENETGWGAQGHANLILDNLLAEGKAKPFIIVMENGLNVGGAGAGGPRRGGDPETAPAGVPAGETNGAARGPGGRGGFGGGFGGGFEKVLLEDLIPYVDANFRTMADQPHRAMAGLSMGGMQTHTITLAHLDTFSHIGMFSGGSITKSEITDVDAFKQKVKCVFISYGSRELGGNRRGGPPPAAAPAAADAGNTNAAPARGGRGGFGGFGGDPQASTEGLKAAGVNAHFYVSPLTAHEWQSWRRSLHEFAPLIFQD